MLIVTLKSIIVLIWNGVISTTLNLYFYFILKNPCLDL